MMNEIDYEKPFDKNEMFLSFEYSVDNKIKLKNIINEYEQKILKINSDNDWNVCVPEDWENSYKIPAILSLIHSEVSEALEAFRKDDKDNFEEEMADVFIRLLDCTGGLKINLADAIENKLEKNKKRGSRHGGKKV